MYSNANYLIYFTKRGDTYIFYEIICAQILILSIFSWDEKILYNQQIRRQNPISDNCDKKRRF